MADSDGKDKTERGRCQKVGDGFSNFAKFLFNRETGQVMGRSGSSWLKILLFYVVFYGFLAGFFAAMLTVFLTTLNEPGKGAPKLIQFLENKPGLTLKFDLSLGYNRKDTDFVGNYSKKVTEFLNSYDNGRPFCNESDIGGTKEGSPCRFDTSLLGPCGSIGSSHYGLLNGTPCFYVRVNKIYGWVPKGPSDDPNFLVLDCNEGVKVFPTGFLIAAFPFRGEKAPYELPVVAVKFNVTTIPKAECKLVGKGIEVSDSYVPHRAFSKIRIS